MYLTIALAGLGFLNAWHHCFIILLNISGMKLNYEEILTDLKKAKDSILSLRKERDILKDSLKFYEKSETELKSKIKILQEENDRLKSPLFGKQTQSQNEFLIKSSSLYTKLEKLEELNPFQFSLQNFIELVKQKNYQSAISQLVDIVFSTLESKIPSTKSSKFLTSKKGEFTQDQDFIKLINESSDLLQVLEKQNNKISEIGKNISNKLPHHKTSYSMANLRVPDFQESYYDDPLIRLKNYNRKLRD